MNPQTGPGGRVCLCLTGATLAQDLEILDRERAFLDLVELRADFLEPGELGRLSRFPALARLPAILTLRRREDGGRWTGAESERRRLLREALRGETGAAGYALVDLEEELADTELERTARERGVRVIRSFHDLRGVPAGLAARVRRLARRGGGALPVLPKAAVQACGSRDQLRLVRAFRALEGVEKILAGMGEFGQFSRILAGRLGSWLTYCSSAGGGSTPSAPAAPGQLEPRTLVELYRVRRLTRDTALFGVVGSPIAHSRSPEIHNRGYAELGMDAAYLPFRADRLGAFLRAAELLGVRGLSVTMPFKQAALRHLARMDAAVRETGACNTLLRETGGWAGANTDVPGFLAPLEREAPGLLAAGGRAAVIGAGGAARAVLCALRGRGLSVLVLNRTRARARELARRFGCEWGGLDERGIGRLSEGCALIVQTTTVGLEGAGDPLPGYRFHGDETVYDLVYSPPLTPLLQRARAAGCRTIGGLAMLQAQAEEQFRLFTGRTYPAGLQG